MQPKLFLPYRTEWYHGLKELRGHHAAHANLYALVRYLKHRFRDRGIYWTYNFYIGEDDEK